MDKLGSRSMTFLIFGLNNKQLEYEGIKRQVMLKVELISKLNDASLSQKYWYNYIRMAGHKEGGCKAKPHLCIAALCTR